LRITRIAASKSPFPSDNKRGLPIKQSPFVYANALVEMRFDGAKITL
jgi:hypothetical protein